MVIVIFSPPFALVTTAWVEIHLTLVSVYKCSSGDYRTATQTAVCTHADADAVEESMKDSLFDSFSEWETSVSNSEARVSLPTEVKRSSLCRTKFRIMR